ncbi:MAG: hypothetical protein H6Q72_1905 [Firmicutes bacterium]|nr:hypothetical protein [Bacillota bacterium]
MPKIQVNADGSLIATRTRKETIAYYNQQIEQRIEALVKLVALGGDITSIKARISQLNEDKKSRLLEVE